ncbi:hypothetical protein BC567DRAFT_299630, partial [Phyllosticta citribraziliensis]
MLPPVDDGHQRLTFAHHRKRAIIRKGDGREGISGFHPPYIFPPAHSVSTPTPLTAKVGPSLARDEVPRWHMKSSHHEDFLNHLEDLGGGPPNSPPNDPNIRTRPSTKLASDDLANIRAMCPRPASHLPSPTSRITLEPDLAITLTATQVVASINRPFS